MLFIRALIAFLALPGTVAVVIPWLIVSRGESAALGWLWPGRLVMGAGLCILLWCVRDFYVAGKGTLAPWDPPRRMVRVGLYRFTRNPMYVGVLTLVTGWTLLSGSRTLAVYTAGLAVAFHLRVILYEEPWLQRQFPAEWQAYRETVSRWVPTLPRR